MLFTAHDNAFAGFEVTHTSATNGKRASAFQFHGQRQRSQLKPGVYVLAGPRAATGSPPALADYAFTGDVRAPVRQSRLNGLDFPYISFAVHGELILTPGFAKRCRCSGAARAITRRVARRPR